MMPNFTGNFRHGRQVNMARESSALHHSSQSVLEKAAAARAMREQVRKREKGAIKIQAFVRSRYEVARSRRKVRERFVHIVAIGGDDLAPVKRQGRADIPSMAETMVAMFIFFFGKCAPPADDAVYIPIIEHILSTNAAVTLSASLTAKFAHVLLDCAKLSVSAEITDSCFRLLPLVQAGADLDTVLESYSALMTGIVEAHTAEKLVDNVIHATQAAGNSPAVVLKYAKYFLSTPRLFVVLKEGSSALYATMQAYDFIDAIVPVLADDNYPLRYADGAVQDDRLLWLVANSLYMWQHPRNNTKQLTLTPLIMRALSNVLIGLSATMFKKIARSMSSNTTKFGIDSFIINNLEILKLRETIESAVTPVRRTLSSTSATEMPNEFLWTCVFFVYLVRIWPGKKSVVRYFLYLTPEYTLPLFFKTIESSRIFKILTAPPPTTMVPASGTLWAPAVENGAARRAIIEEWEILSLFFDICWHWMIMTDDDEFLDESDYGLSQANVRMLGVFLKVLVLLIICNSEPTAAVQRGRSMIRLAHGCDNNVPLSKYSMLTLDKIKAEAVGIMRQLYYRDARRHFLGEGYWLLEDRIDVGSFAQQAVVDEDTISALMEENGHFSSEMGHSSASEEDADSADEGETQWMDVDGGSQLRMQSRQLELRRKIMSTPRYELLQRIPFVLPFRTRVEILDEYLAHDREKTGLDREYELRFTRHKVEIRREHMLDDAFANLNGLRSKMKQLIGITFVNEFGVEAGIDGGGITKEFLVGVCKEAFDPARGLFLETSENEVYPNPAAMSTRQLEELEFLGRIIGKAIYQGILVEVSFAQFFLSKWHGQNKNIFGSGFRNTFDDLWSMDPELYRGLIKLKRYTGNVEADFGLNFTITDGAGNTVELIRNGTNVAVTNTNRFMYIHEVANFKLNKELYRQTNAFLSGLNDLLSPSWLAMFGPHEMQTLVGGAAVPIDIVDWKRNTVYGGYAGESDPTIKYFWEVVQELDDSEAREVLKFVTSVSRAPLMGFASLKPAFTIREAGTAQDRLPTASTCVNLLKLPRYMTKSLLRDKLLLSIKAGAGFDLS
ncbi:uncharacterized protein V1518DRAFT_416192 [Limtongia smithiae]|uniref:uncharacterized protein n=1 Tax=Limtongia smithiae TaxID=1125753 RepID=UPI0034CD82DC